MYSRGNAELRTTVQPPPTDGKWIDHLCAATDSSDILGWRKIPRPVVGEGGISWRPPVVQWQRRVSCISASEYNAEYLSTTSIVLPRMPSAVGRPSRGTTTPPTKLIARAPPGARGPLRPIKGAQSAWPAGAGAAAGPFAVRASPAAADVFRRGQGSPPTGRRLKGEPHEVAEDPCAFDLPSRRFHFASRYLLPQQQPPPPPLLLLLSGGRVGDAETRRLRFSAEFLFAVILFTSSKRPSE
jgi:hypothetical protein